MIDYMPGTAFPDPPYAPGAPPVSGGVKTNGLYVSMYLCIYVSMYLCMYTCIYVSMCICIYRERDR